MTAADWKSLVPGQHDIRMVVSDMDGTLLDEEGRVPDQFWPLLQRMHADGITFVPASGRRFPILSEMFSRVDTGLTFVSENGTMVVHEDGEVVLSCLDEPTIVEVVERVRKHALTHDIGLVLGGPDSAVVERSDQVFLDHITPFLGDVTVVDDLLADPGPVLKMAIYDFAPIETSSLVLFADLRATHQVVVGAKHWIDIMVAGVNKGSAVRGLQESMGITPAQTVVFGDYLNDLEMLQAAGLPIAMVNAHPSIRATAKYLAPRNTEHGVVTTLNHLLGYTPDDAALPLAVGL